MKEVSFNEKEMCALTEYIFATEDYLPNSVKYNLAAVFHDAEPDTPSSELYTPEFEAFWRKVSQ